ncbi:MAG: DNA repair protein RadA, partial [Ruoffia tabacinasalis]
MYECLACGYESPKWLGKCPSCGAWNQMEEKPADIVAAEGKDQINVQTSKQRQEGSALKLDEIEYTQEDRMSTDFQEFDRVLGGGVVEGSLVLIGGDPGIGKST